MRKIGCRLRGSDESNHFPRKSEINSVVARILPFLGADLPNNGVVPVVLPGY